MRKQIQILAAGCIAVAIASCSTQAVDMPVLTSKNYEEALIQNVSGEIYNNNKTTDWGAVRLTTTAGELNCYQSKFSGQGDEIRIYKNGMYMNSIY